MWDLTIMTSVKFEEQEMRIIMGSIIGYACLQALRNELQAGKFDLGLMFTNITTSFSHCDVIITHLPKVIYTMYQ
jgi:hypothetical protein